MLQLLTTIILTSISAFPSQQVPQAQMNIQLTFSRVYVIFISMVTESGEVIYMESAHYVHIRIIYIGDSCVDLFTFTAVYFHNLSHVQAILLSPITKLISFAAFSLCHIRKQIYILHVEISIHDFDIFIGICTLPSHYISHHISRTQKVLIWEIIVV